MQEKYHNKEKVSRNKLIVAQFLEGKDIKLLVKEFQTSKQRISQILKKYLTVECFCCKWPLKNFSRRFDKHFLCKECFEKRKAYLKIYRQSKQKWAMAMQESKQKTSFETIQKLKENVIKTQNGCLEWQGLRFPSGYGRSTYGGKNEYTHRLAYEIEFGKIPDGLWILHKCNNPPCINLDHLYAGTAKDNSRDSIISGTAFFLHRKPLKGEENPRAKLKNEQVRQAKILLQTLKPKKVSELTKISLKTIWSIKYGYSWKSIAI